MTTPILPPPAPGPAPVPTFWLDPGPALTQRTWQRRSRTPVIIVSAIGSTILALLAIGAILLGALHESTFTGSGTVPVPCASPTLTVANGTIEAGSRVTVYDETGDRLGDSVLSGPTRGATCGLTFEVSGLKSTGRLYVVDIAGGYREVVTESALRAGVVLRPALS